MAQWTECEFSMLDDWYRWCKTNGHFPGLAAAIGKGPQTVRKMAAKRGLTGVWEEMPDVEYVGMGVESLPDRIRLGFEVVSGGCWQWTALLNSKGYSRAWLNRKGRLAHCVLYEASVGLVPEGLELDHLCRNRACVNPAHLEAVTSQVNSMRGDVGLHNAVKTHCPQGHPYAGGNIVFKPGGIGRGCRECKNEQNRNYYHANR